MRIVPPPSGRLLLLILLATVALGSAFTREALSAIPPQASPPPSVSEDSVTVAPGARYKATVASRLPFLSGRGNRDLWTTPITVPVIRIADPARPLVPVDLREEERLVLSLKDPGGHTVQYWTIDADVRAAETDTMVQEASADFEQELMTVVHPTAVPAAAYLYDRAGVKALPASIGVMADDPALDFAREKMAGQLVWGITLPVPSELGAGEILTGSDFLARPRPLPIDAAAYLRARLVDLVVGVRRSPETWWWADIGGRWTPLAGQFAGAFANADGLFALLAGIYRGSFQAYGPEYKSVAKLVQSSWDFDRAVLVELTREDWDREAALVREALTDDAIETAVGRIPAAHRALVGTSLIETLRARRDALPGAAAAYYSIIVDHADLELSPGPDDVNIVRRDDGSVEVIATSNGVADAPPSNFRRTFQPGETSEIRLFGGGGADRITLSGAGSSKIKLQVVPGAGVDTVLAGSGFNSGGTTLFDADQDSVLLAERHLAFERRNYGRDMLVRPDGRVAAPDWAVQKTPVLYFDINGDLGLVLGGGMDYSWRKFNRLPYRDRLRVEARFASKQDGLRLETIYWRRRFLWDLTGFVKARGSGIDVVKFFGFGNETAGDQARDFYNVSSLQILIRPGITKIFSEDLEVDLGPVLNYVDTDTAGSATYIATSQPYGSGSFGVAGLEMDVRLRPPKSAIREALGLNLKGGAGWYPEALDNDKGGFGQVWGELRGSYSPAPGERLAVGYRVGLKRLFGTYVPFTYAGSIGGSNSVRGFRDNRFSGDRGSDYGSVELRSYLFSFGPVLFPLDLGALLFVDTGRIYQQGEESTIWHPAWGWGLWARPGWARNLGFGELRGRLEIAYGENGEPSIYATAGAGFRF